MARETRKQYRGYLGNPFLKRPFEQIEFTKEQIEEVRKCKDDLFYFVNNYVHIEIPGTGIRSIKEVGLWPRQVDMLTNLRDNRFNIFKIPRQSAKCFCINTIVKLKNKSTGEIVEMTIGELYENSVKLHSVPKTNSETP